MQPEDEIMWNVLMRHCRRPWGLVSWGYGIESTKEIVSFQVTASTLTPWDVVGGETMKKAGF